VRLVILDIETGIVAAVSLGAAVTWWLRHRRG
jgi:hypothetical protein